MAQDSAVEFTDGGDGTQREELARAALNAYRGHPVRVFISYSRGSDRKDSWIVDQIERALTKLLTGPLSRRSPITIVRDTRDLEPGRGLDSEVNRVIGSCDRFACVVTMNSAKSDYVLKEIEWWRAEPSRTPPLSIRVEGEDGYFGDLLSVLKPDEETCPMVRRDYKPADFESVACQMAAWALGVSTVSMQDHWRHRQQFSRAARATAALAVVALVLALFLAGQRGADRRADDALQAANAEARVGRGEAFKALIAGGGPVAVDGQDLRGVKLRAQQRLDGLSAEGARFDGAVVEQASLSDANLTDAHFARANMAGTRFGDRSLGRYQGTACDGAAVDPSGHPLPADNPTRIAGADFSHADLRSADFSSIPIAGDAMVTFAGANLSRARLRYIDAPDAAIDLRGADLTRADLRNTNLGKADLRGANLSEANLVHADLSRATVDGSTVFSGAIISSQTALPNGVDQKSIVILGPGAEVPPETDLSGTDLEGLDLTAADLSGTDLRWAKLSCADLTGATVEGADLGNAELFNTTLQAIKGKPASVDLARVNGETRVRSDPAAWELLAAGAWLAAPAPGYGTVPSLLEGRLADAELAGAQLQGAALRSVFLAGADLSSANLDGAALTGADLAGADLRRALLTDADLTHADLRDADLSDADLSDAVLSGARLDGANIEAACYSSEPKVDPALSSRLTGKPCQR